MLLEERMSKDRLARSSLQALATARRNHMGRTALGGERKMMTTAEQISPFVLLAIAIVLIIAFICGRRGSYADAWKDDRWER